LFVLSMPVVYTPRLRPVSTDIRIRCGVSVGRAPRRPGPFTPPARCGMPRCRIAGGRR
jgi:hypothetical protein